MMSRDGGVVFLAQGYGSFNLVNIEVPTAPDHISVAPAFETGFHRGTALGLACATRSVDLLEGPDLKSLFSEPIDSLGRDVSIHDHSVAGFPGPDNDHPEPVAELR